MTRMMMYGIGSFMAVVMMTSGMTAEAFRGNYKDATTDTIVTTNDCDTGGQTQ